MNNYEFCAQWVIDQKSATNIRVLDYGCGAGQIVNELRSRNINASGCDVFYEGGDYSKLIASELFDGGVIRRMEGSAIPFESDSFDFIINNQVMEHVPDLDGVLAELERVLKPGGAVLSLFPDKGVWREGHCGIPFLHWFPKGSQARVYYAAGLRLVGLGHHKGQKGVMQWSRDFCRWLDDWTHYRPKRDINSAYGKHFQDLRHIEDYWLELRLGSRRPWVAWLPVVVRNLVVEKMMGLVFVARKPVH